MQWFRWYNDTHRDPKIRALPVEGRWLWATLLDLCSMADKGGIVQLAPGVPYPEDILADEARIPVKMVRPIIEQMKTLGLIREECDGLFIVNWDKRQYRGDNSTERSRLHRQRKRNAGATLQQQPKSASATPPDTDTDSYRDEGEEKEATRLSDWVRWYEEQFAIFPSGRELHDFAKLQAAGVTDDLIIAVLEDSLKEEGIDRPLLWAKRRISDMLPRGVRTREDYERRKAAKAAPVSDDQPRRVYSEFDDDLAH